MTLSYYLQIYRPNALDLIKKYNLYSMLEPLIVLMMKYDEHFVESRLINKQQNLLKNESKKITSTINSNITSNNSSYINSDNEEDNKISGTSTPKTDKKVNSLEKIQNVFTFTPLQRIREAVRGDAVKILVENTDRILVNNDTKNYNYI